MFTGTEFLIGIGVLVVISAIGSVFMMRRKDEPWKITEEEREKRRSCIDDSLAPSNLSLANTNNHSIFED
jgi:hypothetical protein